MNDYFTFIPFKKLASTATRIVHYRWTGWALLMLGSVLMIFAGKQMVRSSNASVAHMQ
ncbi:MAG TPA: hypothetical protein VNI52_02255 [Sphingobacteriaceae bacterium]|nr:hypothetical protein [Sphingobacteriaceae bacterium]